MDFRPLYSIISLLPCFTTLLPACLSLPLPNDKRFITLFLRVTECHTGQPSTPVSPLLFCHHLVLTFLTFSSHALLSLLSARVGRLSPTAFGYLDPTKAKDVPDKSENAPG